MTDKTDVECFVAMWFGSDNDSKDEMNQLYELVIRPAIEHHNFIPYHVGKDSGADKLDETIFNAIDRATFVVVDLTHDPSSGLRGNVLFEAGYAYQRKPIIWMCREDLAENRMPFDIRQFRQIRWSGHRLLEAKKELVEVIESRISERGKQLENHEIRRLVSETWNQIIAQQDIDARATAGQIVPADAARLALFEELYGDMETRVRYKDMGLAQNEKYELMEMIRGWKKIIGILREKKKTPGKDFYTNLVYPKLRASGWLT